MIFIVILKIIGIFGALNEFFWGDVKKNSKIVGGNNY